MVPRCSFDGTSDVISEFGSGVCFHDALQATIQLAEAEDWEDHRFKEESHRRSKASFVIGSGRCLYQIEKSNRPEWDPVNAERGAGTEPSTS